MHGVGKELHESSRPLSFVVFGRFFVVFSLFNRHGRADVLVQNLTSTIGKTNRRWIARTGTTGRRNSTPPCRASLAEPPSRKLERREYRPTALDRAVGGPCQGERALNCRRRAANGAVRLPSHARRAAAAVPARLLVPLPRLVTRQWLLRQSHLQYRCAAVGPWGGRLGPKGEVSQMLLKRQ